MMEAILDPGNIIIAVGSIGTFLTILAFGLPLLGGGNLESRLKTVAQRRDELGRAQRAEFEAKQSSLRQQTSKGLVAYVVDRFNLVNPTKSQKLRDHLSQAGLRSPGHLYTYVFFRLVAPIIAGLVVAFVLFVLGKGQFENTTKFLIVGGSVAVGFLMPKIIVSNMAQKRQQALQRAFPDALDLMVICVEAGLSLEAAFGRVADEIQVQGPELAEEFGLVTAELAFLPDRSQALANLSDRTGLKAMKNLVTSLAQAEKYGTPVSVSLRVLSQEQRDERLSRAEEKAGKLPAQLTVPMIAFFLPVIFVVILGPAAIKIMDATG
jgi:tight adherence protein C